VLVVAQYWRDMATAGRLALSVTGALAALGAGAVVRERADPALARLRGFLWLVATAATALFAGVLTAGAFGVETAETIVLACAGAVALESGLLWSGRARPLQQLTFLGGLVVFAGALVAEFAGPGAVGLTVWVVGAVFVGAGLRRVTPAPLLTEAVGAGAVMVGALTTATDWQAFGSLFMVTTAFALLALAAVPGLAPARADQLLAAIIGGLVLLEAVPGTLGYFGERAAAATGLVTWAIGAALILVGTRRLVRLPVLAEVLGGAAMIVGAALTGLQLPSFAPIFGIVAAVALVALGMLPGLGLLSLFGSLGLLINVPWAIAWFFPGEGRAPLLIFVSGALIIAIAVLLARMGGRFRRELGGPRPGAPPSAVGTGARG
jgi:hypothetical protein